MAQALSPRDLEDALAEGKHLPAEVIEAINELLVKSGSSNHIKLLISEVQKAICERMGITKATLDKNKQWLDFEPYYRAAGWKCYYDGPAYCESYEGFFQFERQR